jgi:hypothetical protein
MIRVMKHLSIPLLDAVLLITIVTSSINNACSFMPLLCCYAMELVARVIGRIEVLIVVLHVSRSDIPEV